MSTINDIVAPPIPVLANFWWDADGPEIPYTIDGNTYPYRHQADEVSRESDTRYAVDTTPLFTAIEFDAVGAASPSNPKVVAPNGVTIIQYLWNFGDGTIGFGPQPSHTYTTQSPGAEVVLIVTDSRGMRFSCAKPLNLIFLSLAARVAYKIRV